MDIEEKESKLSPNRQLLITEILQTHQFDSIYKMCKKIDNGMFKNCSYPLMNIKNQIEKVQKYNYSFEDVKQQKMLSMMNEQMKIENMRQEMIDLILERKPFPKIFQFIELNDANQFEIIYCDKLQKHLIEAQFHHQYITIASFQFDCKQEINSNCNDHQIILESIELLTQNMHQIINLQIMKINDYYWIRNLYQKQLQKQFKGFNEVIHQKMEYLYESIQNHLIVLQNNRNRQIKQPFIIYELMKILLYFANQKEIIIPDLLLNLGYKSKYDQFNIKFRQIICHFNLPFLNQLIKLPELQDVVHILNIPDNMQSEQQHKEYQECYIQEIYTFFRFIKSITIDEVILTQLQILFKKLNEFRDKLTIIYDNQQFKGLISRLKLLYKSEINSQQYPDTEKFNKTQINYILIVQLLSEIKVFTLTSQNNKIDDEQIMKMQNYNDGSDLDDENEEFQIFQQEIKKTVWSPKDYKYVNIFKYFINQMNLYKVPFPTLLTIVQFYNYKFTINCIKTTQEELHKNQQYIRFLYRLLAKNLKKDQQIPLREQLVNLQVDKIIKWPKCIQQQTILINENKHHLKDELKEIIKNKNFQKFYTELIEANETNELRKEILENLNDIFNYIQSK
ncbi:unnamed protein product (macronuclear) [Paramecium tetraurelia]|uniref:Uncharacterized protein n=1 Tax=Paramecium tetraurelia TaxID=5888 RepID=A0D4N0_PARTE|nr:uncharacterized protein GSPATT00013444001 [Paramecium tetraurelia]CAK77997.1 unnamed protein product [Paramecium tetraurelia]|eukprot:XP_001445394.1 hypothetical protein (macronuclear) [Paramecium tetraurelia strain d4-2]